MTDPAPLVPAEVDLGDFAFMRLDVRRLRDSRIASVVSGEEFRSAVLLWCASWHQRPAASLPDDDIELSQLAGFGRALSEWQKVREGALYGWIKCSDGRLYHPVVAEKALEAWAEKLEFRWKRECDRIRKANKSRTADDQIPLPPSPKEQLRNSSGKQQVSDGNGDGSHGMTNASAGKPDGGNGIPAENALKGNGRGNGRENKNADASELRSALPSENLPSPVSTQEADLFRRGREILGANSGGLIKKLLNAKDANVSLARAALETAAAKDNAREYLGAVIKGRDSPEDLRTRGEAW